MNFIDLFAGIGGFRSGLEKNGHKAIAYSEVDKHAKQSYTAIYDTTEEIDLGDITEVPNEQWQELKDKTNIIVGGSPCQSFSLAGKRRGFEDTRGTLFFHYVNAVKEVKPEFFVFENVKGMISHDKGETIKTVLTSFHEIGYDIDFDIFNSKYYGVPQNRERIYIVGKRKDLGENISRARIDGRKKIDLLKNWALENVSYVKLLPENNSNIVEKKLLDILEDEVDEKFYLSEEKTEKLTHEFNEINKQTVENNKKIIPVLTPDRINKRQEGRRFKNDGEPMFTITTHDRHGIAIKEATKQGYALAEQGDSVNVSYPNSKTRRGRVGKQVAQTLQAGEVNQGVVIDDTQGYDGIRTYKGVSPTLRSSRSGLKTMQNLHIRKLTPLECWRLQGFEDEQFKKAQENGVSNNQLYKQAGNAVTVNVVDAIVKELVKHGLR